MAKNKKKGIVGLAGFFVIGILAGVLGTNGYQAVKEKQAKKEQEAAEANYDAAKCVSLGTYKGLSISLAATEEDLQNEIDSLLAEHTEYEQKEGIAENDDMVYADFNGYVDGKKKKDTCGSDYITIGSGEWVEGFEEAFIGVKTGTRIEFSVDIPDGMYDDPEIDGHTVLFKAKLQYICGDEIVPEYNDEFVQAISKYNSTKEYNAYLKKKIKKENKEEKLELSWTEVMEGSKVSKYPETLLESARKEVLQGYYAMADLYGVEQDEIFQSFGYGDEQEFTEGYLDELAQDTVKEGLVAEAIAGLENLSYTTEDYKKLLQEEYEGNSDSYGSKEAYEKENKYYLERTALTEAVKKWIGENTNYTD